MPEQAIDMGMVSAPTIATPAPAPAPAPQPAPGIRPSETGRGPNPRSVGHSPSRDRHAAGRAAAPAAPNAAEWLRMTAAERAEYTKNAAATPPKPAADPAAPPVDPNAPAHSTDRLQVGKYETSEAELAAMLDRQAQDDLRKLTLPATAADYKLTLPEGATLPGGEGVQFRFDDKDPGIAAVRNLAHAKGWSQGDLSDVLAVYASHVSQQEASLAERSRAEVAKVGANAPQRLDAVRRWITSEMGEADGKQISALIVTDSMLRFHERMMTKVTSQGTASFSQSHRVAPDANTIPGYDKMSFEQRRNAQDQLAARRR